MDAELFLGKEQEEMEESTTPYQVSRLLQEALCVYVEWCVCARVVCCCVSMLYMFEYQHCTDEGH